MVRRITCALIVSLVAYTVGLSPLHAEDEVAKKVDRYTVPDGDVVALVKFIEVLEVYVPKTSEEIAAYKQHARKALETAVNRILELEKDKTSHPYRKANSIQLEWRLWETPRDPKTQRKLYLDILAHVNSAKGSSQQDLALAYTFGDLVEKIGNVDLAKEAYREFGKVFSTSDDETLAGYGAKMTGIARRLDLPGKEMKIEGQTVSGEAFDWKSYRGKVVLVDYWATWCGPCIQELPNVKENYSKYHDKGFEVVGISLDSDPARLQNFLTEREISWTCLFEEGAGWNHPMAQYYGVMRIPATMLLDREGKVVSMGIRGGELGRQLAMLLGPADAAEGDSAADSE